MTVAKIFCRSPWSKRYSSKAKQPNLFRQNVKPVYAAPDLSFSLVIDMSAPILSIQSHDINSYQDYKIVEASSQEICQNSSFIKSWAISFRKIEQNALPRIQVIVSATIITQELFEDCANTTF